MIQSYDLFFLVVLFTVCAVNTFANGNHEITNNISSNLLTIGENS